MPSLLKSVIEPETPLVDGEEYFSAVRMEIGRTQGPGDLIYMLGWRFEANLRFSARNNDPVELGPTLALKAAAGVDVRLIMPAKWQLRDELQRQTEGELRQRNNNDLNNLLNWFGPAYGNVFHAAKFRELPVGADKPLRGRVLLDPSSELFGIHHQKMVLVSRGGAAIGFVAGLDFVSGRLDTTLHDESLPRKNPAKAFNPQDKSLDYYWHDAGARLEGPAVRRLFSIFAARWLYCVGLMSRRFQIKGGQFLPSLNPQIEITTPASGSMSTPLPASATPLRAVCLAANFPERDVKGANPAFHEPHSLFAKPPVHETGELYKKAIAAARKYIYIEDQYFDAESMRGVITQAAERGVKIVAVLPGYSDDDRKLVDPRMTSPFLKSLGKERLAVMLVKNTIIHSKLMVIDDEFLAIGSTNFADRSFIEAEDKGGGVDSGLRAFLKEVKQAWSTDSELTVAAVDDRRNDLNAALRLRVLLWPEHLRVSAYDTSVWRQLGDLDVGLSAFNPLWGKPVNFSLANSRLVRVDID
jgi:phosphatidylserine/phosphatidylglycerophosphate/cardiolipin synthase-like enzyme